MSLLLMKPNTIGLTAIKVTVRTQEDADFIVKIKQRIGCKIYEYDENLQIKKN